MYDSFFSSFLSLWLSDGGGGGGDGGVLNTPRISLTRPNQETTKELRSVGRKATTANAKKIIYQQQRGGDFYKLRIQLIVCNRSFSHLLLYANEVHLFVVFVLCYVYFCRVHNSSRLFFLHRFCCLYTHVWRFSWFQLHITPAQSSQIHQHEKIPITKRREEEDSSIQNIL